MIEMVLTYGVQGHTKGFAWIYYGIPLKIGRNVFLPFEVWWVIFKSPPVSKIRTGKFL